MLSLVPVPGPKTLPPSARRSSPRRAEQALEVVRRSPKIAQRRQTVRAEIDDDRRRGALEQPLHGRAPLLAQQPMHVLNRRTARVGVEGAVVLVGRPCPATTAPEPSAALLHALPWQSL